MRRYTEQPTEIIIGVGDVKAAIKEVIEEELPECSVNEWFVDSVHFANMIDKIIDKIQPTEEL